MVGCISRAMFCGVVYAVGLIWYEHRGGEEGIRGEERRGEERACQRALGG